MDPSFFFKESDTFRSQEFEVSRKVSKSDAVPNQVNPIFYPITVKLFMKSQLLLFLDLANLKELADIHLHAN